MIHSVHKCDNLASAAVCFRQELSGGISHSDSIFNCPEYRLIIIFTAGYILEAGFF